MTRTLTLYDDAVARLEALSPAVIPTLARVVFAAVLFVYYWNSAGLKIDGSVFSPSAGAFGQIFPKAAEAVLYDVSQLNVFQRIVIFLGTVLEFILPVLIVVGLFTRLAAIGMMVFILVQTVVDVGGHGTTLGNWFDSSIALIDERTCWIFLMLVLLLKGAGPISLDRVLSLVRPSRGDAAA